MKWKCTQCGRCCKGLNAEMHDNDIDILKKCGYDPLKFLRIEKNRKYLKHKRGKCIFLRKDNICDIQARHGYKFKPDVCRRFPFNKDKSNKIVCGRFLDASMKNKFAVEKNKIFLYNQKIIPSEILLYAIKHIDSDDMAGSWYSILQNIKKSNNKIMTKSDISNERKTISRYEKLKMNMLLASCSYFYFPELFVLLIKKGIIIIKFPCEKIKINFRNVSSIVINDAEKKKFLSVLEKGNNIVYENDYPEHLLFCLFFMDIIAKQLSFNEGRKEAKAVDILNGFSMLNGLMRF